MKESSLWDYLRPRLPPIGVYSRIETDICPGFPDVVYTIEGVTGFIELKSAKGISERPFNEKTGIRKSQKIWISEAIEARAVVWIVAGVGKEIFFIHGSYCKMFNRMTLTEMRIRADYMIVKGTTSAHQIPENIFRLL